MSVDRKRTARRCRRGNGKEARWRDLLCLIKAGRVAVRVALSSRESLALSESPRLVLNPDVDSAHRHVVIPLRARPGRRCTLIGWLSER